MANDRQVRKERKDVFKKKRKKGFYHEFGCKTR